LAHSLGVVEGERQMISIWWFVLAAVVFGLWRLGCNVDAKAVWGSAFAIALVLSIVGISGA